MLAARKRTRPALEPFIRSLYVASEKSPLRLLIWQLAHRVIIQGAISVLKLTVEAPDASGFAPSVNSSSWATPQLGTLQLQHCVSFLKSRINASGFLLQVSIFGLEQFHQLLSVRQLPFQPIRQLAFSKEFARDLTSAVSACSCLRCSGVMAAIPMSSPRVYAQQTPTIRVSALPFAELTRRYAIVPICVIPVDDCHPRRQRNTFRFSGSACVSRKTIVLTLCDRRLYSRGEVCNKARNLTRINGWRFTTPGLRNTHFLLWRNLHRCRRIGGRRIRLRNHQNCNASPQQDCDKEHHYQPNNHQYPRRSLLGNAVAATGLAIGTTGAYAAGPSVLRTRVWKCCSLNRRATRARPTSAGRCTTSDFSFQIYRAARVRITSSLLYANQHAAVRGRKCKSITGATCHSITTSIANRIDRGSQLRPAARSASSPKLTELPHLRRLQARCVAYFANHASRTSAVCAAEM